MRSLSVLQCSLIHFRFLWMVQLHRRHPTRNRSRSSNPLGMHNPLASPLSSSSSSQHGLQIYIHIHTSSTRQMVVVSEYNGMALPSKVGVIIRWGSMSWSGQQQQRHKRQHPTGCASYSSVRVSHSVLLLLSLAIQSRAQLSSGHTAAMQCHIPI